MSSHRGEGAAAAARRAAIAQRRTSIVSIGAAGVLMALKLISGLLTGSLGLLSAGIESSGDVVAASFTFFAIRVGGRPADRDHPYGHRRAENLGALAEAGILVLGGLFVSVEAVGRLVNRGTVPDSRWYVFAVVLVALLIDATRTFTSVRTARRFHSPALGSNAFHFAADMAGSVAVLIGLLAARAGFARGDSIAALVVAGLVFTAAARLIASNANALMDSASSEVSDAADAAIRALAPDIGLRRLRLRQSAGRYFADVVVTVAPGRAVVEGHQAADAVEAAIEHILPGTDIVVHVEPRRRGLDLRDRILSAALSEPLVREAHDVAIFEGSGQIYVSLHLKLPAELRLPEAHEVAERVERAILEQARVVDVQTHLEPLERPLAVRPAPGGGLGREQIEDLVRRHTGRGPRALRVLPTESGEVLFLTVRVGDSASLTDAHALASQLESDLRLRLPSFAEVVVHTEP